ncbi:MAG: GDP-mannose 4,6-dehydratase [Nitrospirae bacterium]|nr:GDP-mannose 4,6-dehydratase [Nitrospirota bacterium]MBI5694769.1 GDP-mannose 4,6-dehydratase [Nitrospirota bacterium]
MKILVTGGAGFIGSSVTDRLLARGDEVVCLDNFDDFYKPSIKRRNIEGALAHKNYKLVEGDIRDMAMLKKLFAGENFDMIFHPAARAGVRPSIVDPMLYEDVNIKGTMNLLEMSREHGIKGFIFASSSSVYGENKKVPFSEEDNVDYPISPYAATKKACELICYTYHQLFKLNITCLRFFTVYGPRQRPEMATHMFTRMIDEGKPIPMFGDGTTKRDYTYIDDIVDGVLKSIDYNAPYGIFNIGESQLTELSELIALIEKNLGKKAIINQLPNQPGDVPITYADISRAVKTIGYAPRTKVEEGVRKFVEWYKENREFL